MKGPEVGRRGQDHQVDLVDDLLVTHRSRCTGDPWGRRPASRLADPLSSERLSSSRSAKASAMATSLTPESAVRACSAAPVPRPPQPTSPTLIVLLPAAWTSGTVKPVETAVAVAAHHRGRRALEEIASRGDADDEVVGSLGALRLRSVSHGRISCGVSNNSGGHEAAGPTQLDLMVTRLRASCYAFRSRRIKTAR